jgi:hypothetical protein
LIEEKEMAIGRASICCWRRRESAHNPKPNFAHIFDYLSDKERDMMDM